MCRCMAEPGKMLACGFILRDERGLAPLITPLLPTEDAECNYVHHHRPDSHDAQLRAEVY